MTMASVTNKDNATSLPTTPTLTASSTALHHLPHALRSACRTMRERNRLWWLIRLSGVWITPTAGSGTPTPESHRAPPLTTRFWASRKGRGRRGFRRSCNVGSRLSSCLVLDGSIGCGFSEHPSLSHLNNSFSSFCAQFAPSFSSITGSHVWLVRLDRGCFFVRAVFTVSFFIASMASTDSLSLYSSSSQFRYDDRGEYGLIFQLLSYASRLKIPDPMSADYATLPRPLGRVRRPVTHSILDQLDPPAVREMRPFDLRLHVLAHLRFVGTQYRNESFSWLELVALRKRSTSSSVAEYVTTLEEAASLAVYFIIPWSFDSASAP
ncbi:hypothetical protein B0H16DRAFT_1736330 [Mycena metata]|uniref:Uncharacterized protein n=1 Tax=Mycena metata TaxID=1033252 RepID=A0AAD7HNX9_9AGAR|nr:hypothetical protein B0H16DRAFT_1736330 [Mycena metata]